MDFPTIQANVRELSSQFAADRGDRQKRRGLERADFDDLVAAGFHLTGVLAEQGGLWESVPESVAATVLG